MKSPPLVCIHVPFLVSVLHRYTPQAGVINVYTRLFCLTPTKEHSGSHSDEGETAHSSSLHSGSPDALFVSADAFMFANQRALVDLATRHKIPAVYPIRGFAAAGGLVSYGTNYPDAFRQVGDYLGRVLNGEKPEDLPVQQVTKLQLVINMKTANTLGLEVPASLLARADEVIE